MTTYHCPQCGNTSPPQPLATPVCLRTWLHTPKGSVEMIEEKKR